MDLFCHIILSLGFICLVKGGILPRATRSAECDNPISKSVIPDSFTIPTFGRDFQLGALYNAVTDEILAPNHRICNEETLQQLTKETKRLYPKPDVKVVQTNDWLTKVGPEWLGLPRNLQLSIATGLVNLTNEGLILYQPPPSRTQVQTILSESHDWLKMSLDDVAQPCAFYYTFLPVVTGATHYVSEITYGYNRMAVLTKSLDLISQNDVDLDGKRALSDLVSLTMDIAEDRDIEMPALFSRNLTVNFYRSGDNAPLEYVDVFEFAKWFKRKDFLDAGRREEDTIFPIRVKLEKIPIITVDVRGPVVAMPFYNNDLQIQADYADTLKSYMAQNFVNYHQYAERFVANFNQFRSIFMHNFRSAIYRYRMNVTNDVPDSCAVNKLMDVESVSPFSNYVTQVWTEILHRQLAETEKFIAQSLSPNICSQRSSTPCFVDVKFNLNEINSDKILNLQETFLPEFHRDATAAALLFRNQLADESAEDLTDKAWESMISKLEALEAANKLEILGSLRENCDENVEVIFSANVESSETEFVTFSLDGKCSENVQELLV